MRNCKLTTDTTVQFRQINLFSYDSTRRHAKYYRLCLYSVRVAEHLFHNERFISSVSLSLSQYPQNNAPKKVLCIIMVSFKSRIYIFTKVVLAITDKA